ncbi:MAG: amino acid ABC transporter substrate-binding protein [Ruminococcaceae bacterium]|nr:amino acid ABC transporter substrate-binding protein [Oscillospiraceae bacterium]
MKKTFKIISLLLVVSMLLAFASCKPDDVTEEPTTTESEVVSTTEKTEDKEKETLIVSLGFSFDYPPYKYKDGDKLNGINVELMKAVADELNMNVEFIEADAHSSHYDPKKYDVLVNRTEDNIENAKLSEVYVKDVQSVIVKASSDYNLYDDFYTGFDGAGYPKAVKSGITIGVKKSTTGDIFASAPLNEWGFGQDNVNEYTSNEEMVNALKNGEITAIVTDDALARNILDEVSGLKILDSTFYSAEYKAAVVSEDSEKQTAILNAINELINDGTAQSIVDKYMEY